MVPDPRPGWEAGVLPAGCRAGAALLLLYPWKGEPHFLLTLRREDLPDHPGQVSLPGGALDEGETVEAAALREAAEEIGAVPSGILILGRLTPIHIPVSNFILHPVLGWSEQRHAWRKEEREVERILEIPLAALQAPSARRTEERSFAGGFKQVPYFALEGEKIWGATAMVLAEFLDLLDRRESGVQGVP